jgi:hypothetical protein
MIYDMHLRLNAYHVAQALEYNALRNLFPVKRLRNHRILAQTCGKPIVMGPVHRDIAARNSTMVPGAVTPMRWERRRE